MPTHEKPRSSRGKHASDDQAETADVAEDTTDPANAQSALNDDIDAILDEIDDVLEENAEEFVRGFVQKGGQ